MQVQVKPSFLMEGMETGMETLKVLFISLLVRRYKNDLIIVIECYGFGLL